MKRRKFLKLFSTVLLGSALTVGLSSCAGNSVYQNSGEFTTHDPTNLWEANNSLLNNGFSNSPISRYVQSELLGLTTYQTVGNFVYGGNGFESTPVDLLLLEGAKGAFVFNDEDTKDNFETGIKAVVPNFDLTKEGSLSDDDWNKILETLSSGSLSATPTTGSAITLNEGTDYWVFTRDRGALQFQNGLSTAPLDYTDQGVSTTFSTDYYKGAISGGTVYQFIIDTDNQWVDGTGAQQVAVSSKDFERTIESYTLASDLNYNRNGYFLSLLGLDFDKTCGYTSTSTDDNYSTNGSRDWTKFDIDNYQSKNDSVFTLYIDTAYPYTFGLLSKEFFNASPHTNQKVHNINMKDGFIKTDNGSIDQANTQWNNLFGSGDQGHLTQDTWYAGAYYVSSFTSDHIIFDLNNTYLETAGRDLLDPDTGSKTVTSTEKKINRINYVFGSGTTDIYYDEFKAKQNDYLAAVPSDKTSEASKLFANNGLVFSKIVQTTQSNYIAYTPNPFIAGTNNTVSKNLYIDDNTAKFEFLWNSENSYLIRAAITGLVNWYQLSLINIQSGDFQLSATPYGVFSDYYENIASNNFQGGIPRPLSDYKTTSSDLLDEFQLPYYDFTATDTTTSAKTVAVKNLTVNKNTLKTALQSYGASADNPLSFSIKFGEGSFSANYQAELNAMKSSIESLTDGLIKVTIVPRTSANPTYDEWYNGQASPLGFSYWSPDYNGVGTWLEADTTLQTANSKEAVPNTNSHNGWLSFLGTMVSAVKASGATRDVSTGAGGDTSSVLYKMPDKYAETETKNLFDDDSRIAKTFSKESLSAFGITVDDNFTTPTDPNAGVEESAKSGKITPGQRYALLGVGLLNTLIKQGVFDSSKFDEYVQDPSKLVPTTIPTTLDQLYIGNDIIKTNQSEAFSKWIGVYAGQDSLYALFENNVLDSDYSYIPRSEAGLSEIVYALVNPNYTARAGSQSTNYRDFGWKNG